METTYKLKEEVKHLLSLSKWEELRAKHLSKERWLNMGWRIAALEPVNERINVNIVNGEHAISQNALYKEKGNWEDQEKEGIEKFLNGELLDIDSLDDEDFINWYSKIAVKNAPSTIMEVGLKQVLKEYLKQNKRNER
jgi:hypothetical protein